MRAPWAEDSPLVIRSECVEVLQNQQEVIFTGQVVAKRQDFTLYADRLVVYYQKSEAEKREVTKMVALGHVRIQKGQWLARAGKAVYFKRAEKVVLTENPSVWQGDNVVRGDVITIYLQDNRSVIEAASGHAVEAVLFTP